MSHICRYCRGRRSGAHRVHRTIAQMSAEVNEMVEKRPEKRQKILDRAWKYPFNRARKDAMSHPVNDQIREELALGLSEIVSAYHHLRQYILADRERLELLDSNDIQFLNRISKAIKEYNPYGRTGNQEDENHAVKVRVIRKNNK